MKKIEYKEKMKEFHLNNFLKIEDEASTLLSDVFIDNNSLPELSIDEVRLEKKFFNRNFSCPFYINAMTGGTEKALLINEILARLAHDFNIPMMLGSEKIAVVDNKFPETFTIAREVNNDGYLIANVGASVDLDVMKKAVELIDANAIAIHLNAYQELFNDEGDRDFTSYMKNIEAALKYFKLPVIVKECGFGMSQKNIEDLLKLGVKYIDISGFGGTNFAKIESMANAREDFSELFNFGTPTALSILYAKELKKKYKFTLIASGGIRTAMDALKAYVIGADVVAIAGELLKYVYHGSYEASYEYLRSFSEKLKKLMLITSSRNTGELKHVKYKLEGRLKDLWEENR